MSAREQILNSIRRLSLEEVLLPSISEFEFEPNLTDQLKEALNANGATVNEIAETEIGNFLKTQFEMNLKMISLINEFSGNVTYSESIPPYELEGIDVAVIEAFFGVAENGALWINPDHLKVPALPFIAKHLVIVLKQESVLANMHKAYQKISLRDHAFGLFIAGPSKTADIEQSLVIGAHGPLSLMVLLTSIQKSF